jgi:NodT family efflux transporter outer membrane factor (OMF) lipoprotein
MNASGFREPALYILACFTMTGCMVGPNFKPPQSATPDVFNRTQTAQATSKPVEADFGAQWWTLFNDPTLDSLEQQLADANLDVAAASARLRQSRAEQRIAGAEEYPTLDGAASYNRERASPNGILGLLGVSPTGTPLESASGSAPLGAAALPPPPSGSPAYNLYQFGFDASWEVDIWGRARRGVEAATALSDASYEDRNAVLLSARAELARDYIQLRDTQILLQIARQNLQIARDATTLTENRVHEGVTTNLDVDNASALAESIEALIPTLESRCDTTINAIGLLLAKEPGELQPLLAEPRDVPALPEQVPIGVPSELVQRRPDIRKAEAQLHAATATIGMAKADFYPRISLNGSAGFQSLQLSNLANWESGQYVVGPSITLPIFEGGRLKGTLHLREAQQQEAAILYQRTVLDAWREVDDALVVYDAEQRRRDRLKKVVSLNQNALSIARQRYKEGAVDFLNVLNVQKQLLDSQSDLEQSQANAAANLITLCKVLGGGWESTYARQDGLH